MSAKAISFNMRSDDEFLWILDGWRSQQRPIPSRSEAIRRLVALGASGTPQKPIEIVAKLQEQVAPKLGYYNVVAEISEYLWGFWQDKRPELDPSELLELGLYAASNGDSIERAQAYFEEQQHPKEIYGGVVATADMGNKGGT